MQIVPRWQEPVLGPSGELIERSAVSTMGVDGWWQWQPVHEPWAGAFQQGYEPDRQQHVLAFSAVYACVSLIANDIAKLRTKLVELQTSGVWKEITNPAYSPVLRKPNRYQTRIQFMKNWMASKLIAGNTYVLKERNNRGGTEKGNVTGLYVLDPRRVLPLITEDGAVYYQIGADALAGLNEDMPAVPASEIIHDRMLTLYHPLVGVSPIYACGAAATQGNRIQQNSTKFFANMSRPSGILTAPHKIHETTAARLKQQIESAISGENVGRLLVAGDGLKYEAMSMMSAVDSQLIEQLRYSGEMVCNSFSVPLSKVSSTAASAKSAEQDDNAYYKQTLQIHIEEIEVLLDEGLGLSDTLGTEMDIETLLRLDPKARAATQKERIGGGGWAPNETRLLENLEPVVGGEKPYLQEQNFSLAALAKRDALPDPWASRGSAPKAPPAEPTPSKSQKAARKKAAAAEETRLLLETLQKGLADVAI